MIKNLLFGLVLSAFAVSASAQTPFAKQLNKRNAAKSGLMSKIAKPSADMAKPSTKGVWVDISALSAAANTAKMPKKAPMKAGKNYEQELWWANTQTGLLGGHALTDLYVTSFPTTVDLGMEMPNAYVGAVIDSVAFFVVDKTVVSNVKVWLGSNVPNDVTQWNGGCTDISSLKDFNDDGDIANYVELKNPYTITDEGCMVGYSFDASAATYAPVVWITGDQYIESSASGSLIMREKTSTGGQWMDLGAYGYGTLAMMVHLQIPELPLAVKPFTMVESTALVNQKTNVFVGIANECFKQINSISYVLTVAGEAQAEQTYTFETPLAAKEETSIALALTLAESGYTDLEFEITKVNGEANNSTAKKALGAIIVLDKAATRIPVAEVITGTWCGYCPLSHVGLDNLKRDLGNGVITLAGHVPSSSQADPMFCESYADVISVFSGGNAPVMSYNRNYVGDPYFGLVETGYGATQTMNAFSLANPAEASFSMSADWTSTDSTSIAVATTTNFLYDRYTVDKAEVYGIAFILSEDGMSGTTAEWLQTNYFSGSTNLPADLASWGSAGRSVQMVYDHVIVGAWNALEGKTGSVEDVLYDYDQPYSTTLDISANTLIQKKTNLSLTALLINRKNGSIVNAAQVALGAGATGIEGVVSEAGVQEVARYNANGVKLSAPQKGLNIIKLNNGKTVKVMVK